MDGRGGVGHEIPRAGDVGDVGDTACSGIAKGGSWTAGLASELRVWARLEVDPASRNPRVGVRCA